MSLCFPSPEVFGLCCFSGAGSTFAAVLPFFFSILSVFDSDRIVVSVSEYILDPFAGCISVPVAVVLPVIAKGENPGVCAMKYRYLPSSSDRLVGNWSHFLLLYLFRVIEDWLILLS